MSGQSTFILVLSIFLSPSLQDIGSTPGLKEILIARCRNYNLKEENHEQLLNARPKCESVWSAFHKAFAFKHPCEIQPSDYEEFVQLTAGPPLENKVLLWSGTQELARYYAAEGDNGLVTIGDIMTGYLVRDINWCGSKETSDGINYDECPERTECNAQAPFWAAASRTFAMRADGIAWLLVNGSRVDRNGSQRPAYSKNSFFAKFELPNLNPKAVQQLVVVVAYDDKVRSKREKCGSESMTELVADAKTIGIPVTCVHGDPKSVKMKWRNFKWSQQELQETDWEATSK